jgi:hypothetical protein
VRRSWFIVVVLASFGVLATSAALGTSARAPLSKADVVHAFARHGLGQPFITGTMPAHPGITRSYAVSVLDYERRGTPTVEVLIIPTQSTP